MDEHSWASVTAMSHTPVRGVPLSVAAGVRGGALCSESAA